MCKDKILDDIFNDDPLGLLNFKAKTTNSISTDERLLASFQEINIFIDNNGHEPTINIGDVAEFQLASRLKGLRDDNSKISALKEYDIHNLLPNLEVNSGDIEVQNNAVIKEINSIDDLLNDDMMNLLVDDSEGLFDFNHTPKEFDRANADFVARRKPCKYFDKYKDVFKEVQSDLKSGKRKFIDFKDYNLVEGDFYVHNGVLLLLEEINISQKDKTFKNGKQQRKDGRTRCVFENGTESNMLYRSLSKILYVNGRAISQNMDKVNEDFLAKFSNITNEDKQAGYIYVLQSKSSDEKISSIKDLYKIGYSTTDVQKRIRNAENEPTYLMAPVAIKNAWECYNLNTQKLEQLLHNFFGNSCLNIDVFDNKGKRHTPQEWFIAPLDVIEQAIQLIIKGEIIPYKYDADNRIIIRS